MTSIGDAARRLAEVAVGADAGVWDCEVAAVEAAVGILIHAADPDPDREGLAATPARFARAWDEMTRGYRVDPAGLFTDFESDGYDEMVAVSRIAFYSTCEHHLLPFHGHAHIAYIPAGRIVGLSKLARLVTDVYAPRLQVQERMTMQIARAIEANLAPKGVAVIAQAEHLCMACRGARAAGTVTTTSTMLGAMRDKPEARQEAMRLLGL